VSNGPETEVFGFGCGRRVLWLGASGQASVLKRMPDCVSQKASGLRPRVSTSKIVSHSLTLDELPAEDGGVSRKKRCAVPARGRTFLGTKVAEEFPHGGELEA
jgi:hypothetical protein